MEQATTTSKRQNYPTPPFGVPPHEWRTTMDRLTRMARESAADHECNEAVTDAVEAALRHVMDDARFPAWLDGTRKRLGLTETLGSVAEAHRWAHEGENQRNLRREADKVASRLGVAEEIRPALFDAICDLVVMGDARPRRSRYSTPLAVVVPTGDALRDGTAVNRPDVIAWVGITLCTTDKELRVVRSKLTERVTPVRGFGVPQFSERASYVHREKLAGKTSTQAASGAKKQFGLESFVYVDADRVTCRHRKAVRGIVGGALDAESVP
jgi:hypothetical protein